MRIIKDCIYKYIEISPLCGLFLDQPEFQRLRRIKQLGNVHRVYPSAVHTRFEHSVGVMHLTGEIAKHLNIDARTTDLLQLAGLYHDIGHMPYSHLFDKVLKIIQPVNVKIDHEERSIDTFLKVSKTLNVLSHQEELFICACIKGEPLDNYDPYLFQIISGGIDSDRLDYMQRDSYHTGMPSFQANYIILNMNINQDKNLCFNIKAKEDIKDLFETRRRMHELVYQHRVSLEYDTMYICMILKIKDELDYDELCDYKLDTLLMTHSKTKHIYTHLESRIKKHNDLCHEDCPIVLKRVYDQYNIEQILWY
jgi:HD superfamily phosphohydrolase